MKIARMLLVFPLLLCAAVPAATAADGAGEVTALRQQLQAQNDQIRQMSVRIEALERLVTRLALSREGAATAPSPAPTLASLSVPPVAIPTPQTPARPAAETAAAAEPKPSPLSVRIGNAEFTPGGFMDFTTTFRSTNVGSGIGTSFGSIPFSNNPAGRLPETRFSAQNSRVTLRVNTKVGKQNVIGYIESDFLGAQPANAFVTSNSNSLRLRLYWVDVKRDKWEFLGGQSWTFLTPNRTGLSPAPSDLFYSQNIDPNYQVGLTWTRAPQFRIVYHPSKNWAAGVAFENPEQYIGAAVVVPAGLATAYGNQLDNAALTSTPNLHPDIISKVAFDAQPGGRHVHVEAVGLLRSFHVFNPAANRTFTAAGGGGSINANLELVKNFRLILHTFYSDGGGRYIFGLGPDLVVRPDGSVSPVHAGSGIGGFEYQATANNMYYGYYGGAYFQRNFRLDPASGRFVGFGFPGSPSSANRSVQEATFGVIRTFWRNPQYGALQLFTQYSYLVRSPWSVAAGQPKNARTNMGYANLRYVLP